MPPPQRARAVDFATHTLGQAEAASSSSDEECIATIRELIEAFGAPRVLLTMSSLGINLEASSARAQVMSALRAFAIIIQEDTHPKLVGKLVGRLCKLDIATGSRETLDELGRQNGIGKQAISKKQAELALRLSIPREDSSLKSRESARLMNRRNYGYAVR